MYSYRLYNDKEIKKIILERNLPMHIIEEKAGKILNKKELALEIEKYIKEKTALLLQGYIV